MNKKLLLASTVLAGIVAAGVAQAADMAPVYKAPPPPVVAPAMWTGFYIGAHVGGGWGTKEWSFVEDGASFPFTSFNVNGPLAGGQIGYNWQSGWVVFGIEADASWADIKGKTGIIEEEFAVRSKVDSLGTIVGRIGGTVDHALLYVLGGAAWVHDKHSISFFECDSFCGLSSSKFRWGWTLGGGVEYAFTPQWSGKIQYNYMDFGTKQSNFCIFSECEAFDITQKIHTVKIGLNYHFNWAPVVAKY